MSVPMHPEAVAGDPGALRWVIPAGTLGFAGQPAGVPAPLAQLLDAGLLVSPIMVEPSAVVLRIAPGCSWRTEGARVRRALQEALARPAAWLAPAGASPDDLLRAAAEAVASGELRDYVASHGGRIEVVEAAAGRVTLSLGGACAGCSASGVTVRGRFETALRRSYPQLDEVVIREEAPVWRERARRLLPIMH